MAWLRAGERTTGTLRHSGGSGQTPYREDQRRCVGANCGIPGKWPGHILSSSGSAFSSRMTKRSDPSESRRTREILETAATFRSGTFACSGTGTGCAGLARKKTLGSKPVTSSGLPLFCLRFSRAVLQEKHAIRKAWKPGEETVRRLAPLLVSVILAGAWAPAGQQADTPGKSRALIVVGLPGDAEHEKLFADTARQWRDWLT